MYMIVNFLNNISSFNLSEFSQFIKTKPNFTLLPLTTKSVNIGGTFTTQVIPVRALLDFNAGLNTYPAFSFILYDFDINQDSLVKTYLIKNNFNCISRYFAPNTTSIQTINSSNSYIYIINAKVAIVDKTTLVPDTAYPPNVFFSQFGSSGDSYAGFYGFDSFDPDQTSLPTIINSNGTYNNTTTYQGATTPGRLVCNIDIIVSGLPAPLTNQGLLIEFDLVFVNYSNTNEVLLDLPTDITINEPISIQTPSGVTNVQSNVTVFDINNNTVHTNTYLGTNYTISYTAQPGTYRYQIVTTYTYNSVTCSKTFTFTKPYTC